MLGLLAMPAGVVLWFFVVTAATVSARGMPGMIHGLLSGATAGEEVERREVVGIVRSISAGPVGPADMARVRASTPRWQRYLFVDRISTALLTVSVVSIGVSVLVTLNGPLAGPRVVVLATGPLGVMALGGLQWVLVVWCVTRSRRDARAVARRMAEGQCCSCGYVIAGGLSGAGACSECGWIRGGDGDAVEGKDGGGGGG